MSIRVSTSTRDTRSMNIAQKQASRRALVQDVRFMLWTGETHIETIARRCNTNPRALVQRLTRAGRTDLIQRMTGRTDQLMRSSGRVA